MNRFHQTQKYSNPRGHNIFTASVESSISIPRETSIAKSGILSAFIPAQGNGQQGGNHRLADDRVIAGTRVTDVSRFRGWKAQMYEFAPENGRGPTTGR